MGITADHAGLVLKGETAIRLPIVGHPVVDLGAHHTDPTDDYPDFVVPLAPRVTAGTVERGIAFCSSGVGLDLCQ